MMKAIALLRVSTEAQAGPDRQGLKAQRRLCESIAAQHGLELVESVELKGASGASVLFSPRFGDLLRHLDPRIGAVVVAEFSRLMRPERLSDYEILKALRASGKALFTPDGKRVLTLGWDRKVKLWDATTGRELVTLARNAGFYYNPVAISPDGLHILVTDGVETGLLLTAMPWEGEENPASTRR